MKTFFFVDIGKGQLLAGNTVIKKKKDVKVNESQVLFESPIKEAIMSPKTLDMLVSQNIVSQLTSNLSDNAIKMNILSIVLGLIIGAMGGYLYAVSA